MTQDAPRLDRTGDIPVVPDHDPRCEDGWIDRDSDPAIPCLTCRPNLAKYLQRRRRHTEDHQ